MSGADGSPILDENGNTVPKFRYDIEYKIADGQTGPWCSQGDYRDLRRGDDTLNPTVLKVDYTSFCANDVPVVGESYNFRIRASYVWLTSGDTNVRNGPWTYSGPIVYNPTGGAPETPTDVKAVGGKNSLLVFWQPPAGGTPADYYLVQWRTGWSYKPNNEAVVSDDRSAQSFLIEDMDSRGPYYVRVVAATVLGQSEPSEQYFVMSGVPGAPVNIDVEVKPGGWFVLTWGRPDPYYPNNPHFSPVSNTNGQPLLDDDGNTVPRVRFDVEYRLEDGPPGPWCSQSEYQDLRLRDYGLHPGGTSNAHFKLEYPNLCDDIAPEAGQPYNFRIRGSYVWANSLNTNYRNGLWSRSGPVVYNP